MAGFKAPKTSYRDARAEARRIKGVRAEDDALPTRNAKPGAGPDKAEPAGATVTKATEDPSPPPAPKPSPNAPDAPAFATTPKRKPKLKINVTAPYPAPGVSKFFDQAAARYGERTAMTALVTRALAAYEDAVLSGAPVAQGDYAATGEVFESSRRLSRTFAHQMRDALDPMRILSEREFGRQFTAAALARFFAAE